MEPDILVIGGGPAGVSTSIEAARQGLDVILVDRKSQDVIGDKVCGDALDVEAVEFVSKHGLDVTPKEGKADWSEKVVLVTEKSRFEFDWPSYVVDRHRYGQQLLREALNLGVKVFGQTRPLSIENGTEHVTVKLKSKSADAPDLLKPKVVVDASGAGSNLGAIMPEAPKWFTERAARILAYRQIIQTESEHGFPSQLYLGYEPEVPSPGYFWVFSRGVHEANIGLGYKSKHAARVNLKTRLDKIRERVFPDAKIVHSGGGTISGDLMPPRLDFRRIVKVGDAGRVTNPMTGAGHGEGLVTGFMAARAVKRLVDGDEIELLDPSNKHNPLYHYSRWTWREYGSLILTGLQIVDLVTLVGLRRFLKVIDNADLTQQVTSDIVDGKPSIGAIYSILKGQLKDGRLALELGKTFIRIGYDLKWLSEYPSDPVRLQRWWKRRDRRITELKAEYQ